MNLKITIEFYSKADTEQFNKLLQAFALDHNDILPKINVEISGVRHCTLIATKWEEGPRAFQSAFREFLGDILTSYICTIQSDFL